MMNEEITSFIRVMVVWGLKKLTYIYYITNRGKVNLNNKKHHVVHDVIWSVEMPRVELGSTEDP